MPIKEQVTRALANRTVVIVALCYIVGILTAFMFINRPIGAIWPAGILVVLAAAACRFKVIGFYRAALLVVAALCGGITFFYTFQHPPGAVIDHTGTPLYVEGTVCDEPLFFDDHAVYRLRVEAVEKGEGRLFSSGTLLVKIYGQSAENYRFGEKLRVRGTMVEPRGQRNPGGFDYRFYLRSQGIDALLYAAPDRVDSLGRGTEGRLQAAALSLRSRMARAIEDCLPSPSAEALTAILFGQRDRLPEEIAHNFQRAGAGHLLAVSGLHVGLVAALITGLWRRLGLRGRLPLVLAIMLVFAYAYLTGMRPSALRAAIMVSMALGALLLDRERDLPTAVSLAALITLFINPLLLFTPGFQLSYAATLTLIYAYRPLQKLLVGIGCPAVPASCLAVVLAAQLGVLPLCIYHFHHLPTGAIFFNLLLMPLMAFIIGFGLVGALVSLFLPLPGDFILWAARPLLEIMLQVTGLSRYPGLYISLQPPAPPVLILFYGLLTALLALYYRWEKVRESDPRLNLSFGRFMKQVLAVPVRVAHRHRRVPALVLLTLMVIIIWWGVFFPPEDNLRVMFIDVGQGASALIEAPCGAVIMVDAGGDLPFYGEPGEIGERVLLPLLRRRGINKIDLALISHPHEDHFGGFIPLIDEVDIGQLLVSPVPGGSGYYEDLLARAEAAGIPVEEAWQGQVWSCGPDLRMKMHWPPERLLSGTACDLNNNSIVFILQYGEIKFLFTGDVEDEAVSVLLREQKILRADVLQVPHHGGYLARMPEFLEAVRPRCAVIQVGSNPFGHPHPYVIESLKEAGVKTYRNDLHGAVMVETDGHDLQVQITERPVPVLHGPAQ